MNTKLLLKVKRHILQKPSRLRMSNWIVTKHNMRQFAMAHIRDNNFVFGVSGYGKEPDKQPIPECGTVGCIAGWTCLLRRQGKTTDPKHTAMALLGLETGQSDLFYPDYWPSNFHDAYLEATTQRQRAKIVGQVIDDFIATDGWKQVQP